MEQNTFPLEAETRVLIDRNLENLGWNFTGINQNVFLERPKKSSERKKLSGKRADYILYSNDKPIIVIEAKRKGNRLDTALEQGIDYARAIAAPLVFATDGVFCKSFHTIANRPPILNGEEVDEFIRESLALRYLTTYEVNTVSPKVQYDRKELIRIFDEANNMLRGEGLRAGIERFGEFANILFLKLISESEQIKKENGIPTKFDEACSWESIKNIPATTRIEYINKTVYDKLNALYKTDIFTPLQIKNEAILKEIMDKLDPLMLTDVDSDVKGDAFEYFLKASTSTKNDLGEYFTPRHIVKTMVRLVNPQIGERIYDPFCGTGGFLIECFRYIYNNMARTDTNLDVLRFHTVYGNEITNTARITKMNMILAGDGHSNIEMKDSLANPVNGNETYVDEFGKKHNLGFDIVLTNMPYSQKTKYGYLYDLPSANGDSICVQHCIKAINSTSENGRMAIVVPEGFLFRKDLTRTREYLLDRCQLQSIISLPQGVFLPYTGVKTDIIFATKINQKIMSSEKRKDFWFFDVKSDGYTLDNHRRKLNTPSDLSKYEEYRKLDKDQTDDMLKVGFEIIPLDKVRKNSNILAGSRYRDSKVRSNYETACFSDVATLTRGVSYKKQQQTTFRTKNIILPADNITLQGELKLEKEIYVDDTVKLSDEKRLQKDDIFICMSSGSKEHIGKVAFIEKDTKFYAGGFMGIIRVKVSRCLSKYLYYYFNYSTEFKEELKLLTQGANINNISSTINAIKIPLPPVHIQKEIVTELDRYQNIIFGAQQIISNYTPSVYLQNECDMVRLGDLFEIVLDTIDPKTHAGIVRYIGLENIVPNTGEFTGILESDYNSIKSLKRVFKVGDILYGKLRPALNKVAYADFDGICSTDIIVLRSKSENILPEYYSILLRDSEFNLKVMNGVSGGQLPRVDVNFLMDIPVQIVSRIEQEKALEQIHYEKELINSSKGIVQTFVAKIYTRTKEIWG